VLGLNTLTYKEATYSRTIIKEVRTIRLHDSKLVRGNKKGGI